MNHIYFTALANGAGLAAEIAAELDAGLPEDSSVPRKTPRVYEVKPLGSFDNDPNVTDKKFPGNPTRSYRSDEPLQIIREVHDWTRLTPRHFHSGERIFASLLLTRVEKSLTSCGVHQC